MEYIIIQIFIAPEFNVMKYLSRETQISWVILIFSQSPGYWTTCIVAWWRWLYITICIQIYCFELGVFAISCRFISEVIHLDQFHVAYCIKCVLLIKTLQTIATRRDRGAQYVIHFVYALYHAKVVVLHACSLVRLQLTIECHVIGSQPIGCFLKNTLLMLLSWTLISLFV